MLTLAGFGTQDFPYQPYPTKVLHYADIPAITDAACHAFYLNYDVEVVDSNVSINIWN
jgi:hypothetical protein